MAHEIDFSRGTAAMAYVGEAPWHGLGRQLTEGADLDTWIREAQFDWDLVPSPVLYKVADTGELMDLEGRVVLYRSDTRAPISVVSNKYKVVQPRQVAEFFRDLTELGGYRMETMGVLRGGRYYWALARPADGVGGFNVSSGLPANLRGVDDWVEPYVLLATSSDGSMSTVAHLTSVRVVCMNTLQLSVGEEGKKAAVSVPHFSHFDPDAVKAELGLFPDYWAEHQNAFSAMAWKKISTEEAVRFFVDVYAPGSELADLDDGDLSEIFAHGWELAEADKETPGMVSIARLRPKVMKTMEAYERGPGADLTTARGTVFGAVNAVTRFWDHEYPARQEDNRLVRSWLGNGATEKQRAYQIGRSLAL